MEQCVRTHCSILMHVKRTIPYLFIQPPSVSKHVEDIKRLKIKILIYKGAFCWFILYNNGKNLQEMSRRCKHKLKLHEHKFGFTRRSSYFVSLRKDHCYTAHLDSQETDSDIV